MEILKSIRIKNYRSILEEKFDLENMVAIIGANESGKSNVLNAISHITPKKQKQPFELHELNLCEAQSVDNSIEIEFEIILGTHLIPDIIKDIPNLNQRPVLIKKKGIPTKEVTWTISIDNLPKANNLIVINGNKTIFRKQLKETGLDKEIIEQWIEKGYFFCTTETNLTKNPFFNLKQQNTITILTADQRTKKVHELVLTEVLRNIQVYFWQYDETNYLRETIGLEEFCQSPKINESVYGIFKIARNEGAFHFELNAANLRGRLIETNSTHRSNLLKEISKSFNKIFKKSWKTYFGTNKIDLKINYEGTCLSFRLDDGRECPPEYRSDGLKWFLTFLINFQSKQKDLSDYILLMDEPGGLLHPQGQKDALNFLIKLAEKNQIIYTTHQTFLIDKNNPQNVRILDRKEIDRKSGFWPTKVHSIRYHDEHILKDSLLRESLGFTLSDISPINENNILVEGTFDRNIIQLCNNRLRIFDFNFCSVISCGRASNIRFQANHFQANGLNVLCLYDHDPTGITAFENNSEIPDKFKLFVSQKNGETIEDILPDEIFISAFNKLKKNPIFKSEFKETVPEFKKPFIANVLDKQLNNPKKERRQELKHELENIMLELVKKDFENDKYPRLVSLLKTLKTSLEIK
jgi:AAA15 family ATPase/GTPase